MRRKTTPGIEKPTEANTLFLGPVTQGGTFLGQTTLLFTAVKKLSEAYC